MDSHPKKKKKEKEKPVQSKSEINPRSRCWQRKPNTVHTKQKQTKPHYPILQYRLVYQKKKNQYRENQTPDPEQTKPTVRRRWSRRSQAQLASSLVVLVYSSSTRRSSAPRHCSSQIIVDRKSVLGCSGARSSVSRYFSLFFSLSLTLSLSH